MPTRGRVAPRLGRPNQADKLQFVKRALFIKVCSVAKYWENYESLKYNVYLCNNY